MNGAVPDYVRELRAQVGQRPIIVVCGCCAVVDRERRVLLQQRADPSRPWGLPGGAMELGETPELAAVRETKEETGLEVRLLHLLGVYTAMEFSYPNGDVVQAVDVTFVAETTGGTPRPDGIETLAQDWFHLDALPGPLFHPHLPMLAALAAGRVGEWGSSF